MSDEYTVARFTKDNQNFEILVKPQPAFEYTLGKETSISKVLVSDVVFTDANKGMKPSEEKLKNAFGTLDSLEIAAIILKKGTLKLTTAQRRQLVEEKRKQIVSFIARFYIDPRTKLPHPPQRIANSMEQIKYSIDPFKDAEEQAKDVTKLLRAILPLKMEQVSVEIRIPSEFAAKAYGTIKGFGTIKREKWLADGSLTSIIEIPAGFYGPLLEKLGNISRGNAEAKLVS